MLIHRMLHAASNLHHKRPYDVNIVLLCLHKNHSVRELVNELNDTCK
jgi:hypothetical protein